MMHPSESMVRRKPGGNYSSNNISYAEPMHASSTEDISSHNYAPSQDDLVSKEPEFRYQNVLMMCLAPPLAIMLAFGGRPSLLVICFGTMLTYIFDLLGAMEV